MTTVYEVINLSDGNTIAILSEVVTRTGEEPKRLVIVHGESTIPRWMTVAEIEWNRAGVNRRKA